MQRIYICWNEWRGALKYRGSWMILKKVWDVFVDGVPCGVEHVPDHDAIYGNGEISNDQLLRGNTEERASRTYGRRYASVDAGNRAQNAVLADSVSDGRKGVLADVCLIEGGGDTTGCVKPDVYVLACIHFMQPHPLGRRDMVKEEWQCIVRRTEASTGDRSDEMEPSDIRSQ